MSFLFSPDSTPTAQGVRFGSPAVRLAGFPQLILPITPPEVQRQHAIVEARRGQRHDIRGRAERSAGMAKGK